MKDWSSSWVTSLGHEWFTTTDANSSTNYNTPNNASHTDKILFPIEHDIGVLYCRLLLHDTMLNDDSFRSGTATYTACNCGAQLETAEHFLFHCSTYEDHRESV